MMIQKRPKGEALEPSAPAEGRPAGGVRGGGAAPPNDDSKATGRAKRSGGARVGCGAREPPRYHHPLLRLKGRSARAAPGQGCRGGREPTRHNINTITQYYLINVRTGLKKKLLYHTTPLILPKYIFPMTHSILISKFKSKYLASFFSPLVFWGPVFCTVHFFSPSVFTNLGSRDLLF